MEANKPLRSIPDLLLKGVGPEMVRRIGITIGTYMNPGTTIALFGQLGAGKTTMIQSICEGLDVTEPVTSPTFTIVNQYRGRYPVFHIDLYRLKEKDELDEIGLEELLNEGGVVLFEWPEKVSDHLESPRIDIELKWTGPAERDISFSFYGDELSKDIVREIERIAGGAT